MSTYRIRQIKPAEEAVAVPYPSVNTIIDETTPSDWLAPWSVKLCVAYIKEHSKKELRSGEGEDADKMRLWHVVNEQLLEKAKKEYRTIGDTAMDEGSTVHDLIEKYIKFQKDGTDKPNIPDNVQSAFLAFLQWEKDNQVKWLEAEHTIYCNEGYAGRLDAVAEVFGKVWVIDFKAAKDFYPEYWLQIAAYRYARCEMNGEIEVEYDREDDGTTQTYRQVSPRISPIHGIGILRLDKETGYPDFRGICDEYEIRFDKRKQEYKKKSLLGMNVIRRYQDAYKNAMKYYYLLKNRTSLKGNPWMAEVNNEYSGS